MGDALVTWRNDLVWDLLCRVSEQTRQRASPLLASFSTLPKLPRLEEPANPSTASCRCATRMVGGSGEGPAMSPSSSPGGGGSGSGGKRGRDPEEDVYVDNLHSHKRYLSEVGLPKVSTAAPPLGSWSGPEFGRGKRPLRFRFRAVSRFLEHGQRVLS
jgi:hypothetical protein